MELQLPKGMRDFPPEEKLLRDTIVSMLTILFQRYGFNPLETPVVERWDVLNAKHGASDETDVMKEVYRFTDQGKRELGLRYDLTVPATRFVSMNPQLKMPFKRYQIGTVYRDGPIKLGRYREFIQCDFDIFGCKNLTADAEILQLYLDAFQELDLDAVLEVNNRKLLSALIELAGVPEEQVETVMITIDKLDKQGDEGVRKELLKKGLTEEVITKLLGYFQITGTNEERLKALEKELPQDKREGIEELRELLTYVDGVYINPALARGLAYYTGTVFEGRLLNTEITSSICAGGRYDGLVNALTGNNSIPAVGGSFGLEPISEYLRLRAKGQQGIPKTAVEVFVIPIKCYEKVQPFVKQLRAAGINTEVDLMARGISKNLEYANALDIHYVIIVGPKELEAGKVTLKDMRLGEETLLSLDEVTARLQ